LPVVIASVPLRPDGAGHFPGRAKCMFYLPLFEHPMRVYHLAGLEADFVFIMQVWTQISQKGYEFSALFAVFFIS
jgi:hypothetical protein